MNQAQTAVALIHEDVIIPIIPAFGQVIWLWRYNPSPSKRPKLISKLKLIDLAFQILLFVPHSLFTKFLATVI